MDKQKTDHIITEYLPKIYGFAVKKSFSYDEAEDLCGDILQEVYLSLLKAEEIINPEGYVWRICEHIYSKYVAGKKKHLGVSIDGMEIPFYEDYDSLLESTEEDVARLRREIAFLTKRRREIVTLFYYEDRTISYIADKFGIPEGTVKWHLNKARNELKEGFSMERKIGRLGISPVTATSFGHSGNPDPDNNDTERYLGNKLNLNIVYSVYHEPKTVGEISEELGVTPVFIEDTVKYLEANGFLVRTSGNRFTTYVMFSPLTYFQEQADKKMSIQYEIAKVLAKEYVPLVREAIAGVKDVWLPEGNRELLEAAAAFYGMVNKCDVSTHKDLSKYRVRTIAGGDFIPMVDLASSCSDPEYKPAFDCQNYWACGNMNRHSGKYPAVSSWAIDTRFCSRKDGWWNNLTSDYEYLYEFMTGVLQNNAANEDKFNRLRKRGYLTEDNKVSILIVKESYGDFFERIPSYDKQLRESYGDIALEYAMLEAGNYPPQMQDIVVDWESSGFTSTTTALMAMDILYGDGTFRPLTEKERVTSNLIMFSDVLP